MISAWLFGRRAGEALRSVHAAGRLLDGRSNAARAVDNMGSGGTSAGLIRRRGGLRLGGRAPLQIDCCPGTFAPAAPESADTTHLENSVVNTEYSWW
jgi:hypothetical protein